MLRIILMLLTSIKKEKEIISCQKTLIIKQKKSKLKSVYFFLNLFLFKMNFIEENIKISKFQMVLNFKMKTVFISLNFSIFQYVNYKFNVN